MPYRTKPSVQQETGNEVFETEEREQARNEKSSWTTGSIIKWGFTGYVTLYVVAAAGIIIIAAIIITAVKKYNYNITTYPVRLKLNGEMSSNDIWEGLNALNGIKGKDEAEALINFKIESDNAKPIECVLNVVKASDICFNIIVWFGTELNREFIGVISKMNVGKVLFPPILFRSRIKLGENPMIKLDTDNEFIRNLIQIVPEGEAQEGEPNGQVIEKTYKYNII